MIYWSSFYFKNFKILPVDFFNTSGFYFTSEKDMSWEEDDSNDGIESWNPQSPPPH